MIYVVFGCIGLYLCVKVLEVVFKITMNLIKPIIFGLMIVLMIVSATETVQTTKTVPLLIQGK